MCVSTSLCEIMEGVPASILQSAENVKVKLLSIIFFFFMNGNTERAECALSRVCIPCKKEKKCNKTIL